MKSRTVKVSFLIAAVALCVIGYREAGVYLRRELPPGEIELLLASPQEVYGPGEKPRFSLTLVNKSSRTLVLAPALDGSGWGRSPLVHWKITPPPGALPMKQVGICGNTNPLRRDNFQKVPPGGIFNVGAAALFPQWELERGPGSYTIQAKYSTAETDLDQWLGGPMSSWQKFQTRQSVLDIFAKVPRFTVTSNPLHITIPGDNVQPHEEHAAEHFNASMATVYGSE